MHDSGGSSGVEAGDSPSSQAIADRPEASSDDEACGPPGSSGPRSAGLSEGGLWRSPDFLKFWIGETVSLFGAQVTYLALPLTAVLTLHAGPGQVGTIRFLELLPYPLFGLLFGVWADRVRRRPIMITANLVRMILIGLVPVLAAAGQLRLDVLFALTFGIGTASVLFDVTWMSYVPTLVQRREQLLEANSKLSTTSAAADVAGPGAGGLLVAVLTAPTALATNAACYLVSVISLLLIKVDESPPQRARRHIRTELADGLRWVFSNTYLRSAAFVGGFCNFFATATATLFILYGVRAVGLRPGVLGLIISGGAVGGVLGAMFAGRIAQRLQVGRTYKIALAGAFIAPALIPAASGPKPFEIALFVAAFFFIYVGVSVGNVLMISVRQMMTPTHLMGRMNAAMRTLMYGLGALGGAAAGIVGVAAGLHTALWVFAAAAAACIIPVLLSPIAGLREMPKPADDLTPSGAPA